MRYLFLSVFIAISFSCISMNKIKIYCFPGQGADKRQFDSIVFDPLLYEKIVIEYGTPEKHMNLHDFAKKLAGQIDTSGEFILIGVSLGGMICTELSEILHPLKTIIISSAKNRKELPTRYRFQRIIPIYKIFPGFVLLAGAKILQPIVEPDSKENREIFRSMLAGKSGKYMKRTIRMIIQWKRITNANKIYHIHGTRDHTLPIKKVKTPDYVVKNGSHMMTLTKAREINLILNQILVL